MNIALQRLYNQRIAFPPPASPGEVVAWMGMVQAQDYLGALWAVGLRSPGTVEASIEQALAERSIVRSWPARGTLHFTAAADLRWMMALLAPRRLAGAAGRFRQLGLDEATFARSRELVSKTLQGGRSLARPAIYQLLETAHISTAGQRGIHILWRLAQDGLICFGPRQGKQHTFVLLDEWLPPAPPLSPEEALAELARRYFTSHGPASLADFAWWSGLSKAEARAGVELAAPHLSRQVLSGQVTWQSSSAPIPFSAPLLERDAGATPCACLLPAFDEYLVGYSDRSAVLNPGDSWSVNKGGGILNPVIVIDGLVVGTWKRTLRKAAVAITPAWFNPPGAAQQQALAAAARAYAAFLGLEEVLG